MKELLPGKAHIRITITSSVKLNLNEYYASVNGPYPSSSQFLFQSESKCKVFVMNISFPSYYIFIYIP